MPTTELSGLTVLVTRPEHQAASLCRLIEQAGGQALRLPLLTIHDTSNLPAVTERLARLGDYDLAIFISPNAVRYGVAAIHRAGGGLPAGLKLATVGQGSARQLLESLGRGPDLVPSHQFDSEGLLALEALQRLDGKRVLILRGNGGRELLADTLRQRGAQVDYLELYRRAAPAVLVAGDDRLAKADIIIVTSSEGLNNLLTLLPEGERQGLLATPLLLVSARTAEEAQHLGFHGGWVLSAQASDEAIVEALKGWAQRRPTTITEE